MVFLRSFLSGLVLMIGSSGTSVEVLLRPIRILDFFLVGRMAFTSIVGAVMMISGAGQSLSA
jgi:hypothetical protein